MLVAQHNSDTSIAFFANELTLKLKDIIQMYSSAEIERVKETDFTVEIVKSSLANELDKLIKRLDNESENAKSFLPKILITKSSQVNTASYGMAQMKFAQKERLTIFETANPDNKKYLEGTWFEYDVPIQILIITKVGYANKELSLELLRILYELRKVYYSLLLQDNTDPLIQYVLEDYGSINVMDFENKDFGQQVAGENESLIINTLDFSMREQYFKLVSADEYSVYSIESNVK